jgi:hypothetical protein
MKQLLLAFGLLFIVLAGLWSFKTIASFEQNSGAPPYDTRGDYVTETEEESLMNTWKRPEGKARVALQVGHWKTNELPDELQRLRGNTGATGGGKAEWEVNYEIATATAQILEKEGISVTILPATIPKRFWADVFVAIHADGSLDTTKSGFKLAAPRRDRTGKAEKLITEIQTTYQQSTGFAIDPNVTRNMRGYYAFAWWRFDHAIHPMTTAVILETGFLSSPQDRRLLVNNPSLPAEGLAQGILNYLTSEELLKG